ncbi:SulP family inorganic anion transporter [Bordetella pseudohinzii]|uniref:Sulfate transporter n=1 Tax=Bordetella pseudohinzii TaxID=1331258 RepID=A0A0J6CCQ8_9BORD|nr:SulP family inorganic anion transporter [Bordetella pseudohinzii]ANY15303.1 sulfate transporter [Bordetella pseudohinzii]KMM27392.1 sulfate transporter [Bordetella pseudohinzii]KXA80521.1 sulfate transporter [Bordetella pseudohinzii]KXA82431.1 sulfate transporter [Bordetella pseudohinzii]CUI88203.1 Probable sulfate transporter Rv1739c/MT1781 [Bordetella pseudohinzii]
MGSWVHDITPAVLRSDAAAGLLGALLVLPQGMAFALLAGLPPQYGLYTAIVPCVIAGLFGSSRHVLSGPTNANSLALFAVLAPMAVPGSPGYIELALAVTVLVGLMQLAVSLLRLGVLANFISPAALFGFTSGAAILIALHALKDAFGIAPEAAHSLSETFSALLAGQVSAAAIAVTLATLVCALAVRRWGRRRPHMLAGLAAGTAAGWLAGLLGQGVAVLGPIAQPLPPLHLPEVDWRRLPDMLGVAVPLTIVALAQSISIAKAVAQRSGQPIDPNREFFGQGLSNAVGGLFSCYLSCGSLNRSMPNYEAGARTPMAAVFSALILVVLILLSAPLLAHIPYAAIAGLLLLVAWTLLDVPRWRWLARVDRNEAMIAAATLAATLFIRMEVAIMLGALLSLSAYLYRTSRPAMRIMGFDAKDPARHFIVREGHDSALPECPQLRLLRMEGSVYFGAAAYVDERLAALRQNGAAHLLVMTKSMNFIDQAGAQVWEDELKRRRAAGGDLYFHRPRPEVLATWRRTGFIERLGQDHIFPDKTTAIASIYQRLDPAVCRACEARCFRECGPPGTAHQSGQADSAAPPEAKRETS